MKKPAIHITDHALLRYLERVLEMDIEAHRRAIGHAVQIAQEHEGCTGVVIDGFSYKLSGNTVITIAPAHLKDKRTARCPRTGERPE